MLNFATFANNNDALIPELWARESIAVLEENMVMGNLIHRDFSNEIAAFGDVVNTRKPGDMTVNRKTDADTVSYNDAILTNVQVPLDQHMYTGFVIKDGEGSKSMQDLIAIHLVPALKSIANGIDRAILGRMAHALLGAPADRVGKLLGLSSSNAKDFVLAARERLNRNLASLQGRQMVLAPGSETAMLSNDLFIKADERGDSGSALTEARLGRILGFNTYMDQNVNGIAADASLRDSLAGTAPAASAGDSGSLAVAFVGHEVVAGEFVVLADNAQPTWASAATVAAGDTSAVTLHEALKYDVAGSSVATVYKAAAANGAYAAQYSKGIDIDGHAAGKNLVLGQLVAFGSTAGTRHVYSVIEVLSAGSTNTTVLLDRPLDSAIADDDACFPGPAGDFNACFQRDSVALISRPLAQPENAFGARSFVASHNNIAMRATMQYDIDAQGTKVVLDLLAGVAVLDNRLACLLLG